MLNNLRKSWKLIALFAVVAIVSLCYVVRSRAFVLIENQYLPAVQLVANQSAMVKVANVSNGNINATVDIIADNGTLLVTKTVSLPPARTFTVSYMNPPSMATRGVRAVIELDTADASVSSIMTLDKTTGEVIAILPFIKFTGNGQ